MATLAQLEAGLIAADKAGNADDARAFAAEIRKMRAKPAATGFDPATANPTDGMSTFDKAAAGVGKAMSDTWLGLRSLTGNATGEEVAERRRLDAPLMDTGAGMAGNIAGQVGMALAPGGAIAGAGKLAGAAGAARAGAALSGAGQAAMAPTTIKGAAALGGAFGLAQPAVDTGERAMNAGLGGLGSAGGHAVLKGLARVVSPQTDANALKLMAEGITPTPGQILGGGWKRTEEALTSIPLAGDVVKGAQRRGIEDLNRAAINRSLKPVGESLPKGLVGREAIQHAEEVLGKKYDALLPSLTTQMDGQFITDVQSLRNMMGTGSIDPAMAQRFEALLQSQVLRKFQPGANSAPTITGQTMKAIESDLGQMARNFRTSADPDQRMLGDALLEVQDILRQNVMRSNPQAAPQLKAINEGWANFKRAQKAAAGVGAEDGVFTAAQLQNAVKAADRSKDKAKFARGDALMQDLSDPAKAVLAQKVPDSGTPFRAMTALGLGGAAGAGGGYIDPGTAVGIGALPLMFSRPGQQALVALLAKRPEGATQIGNALERLAPYAALPALGASTQQR